MIGALLGALAIAMAYAAAFLPPPLDSAAPWLMVGGNSLLLISLVLLGTRRRGRRRSALLLLGVAALALVLVGGFGAVLLLPAEAAGSPLWLGLPPRAAILVYGIGLLPVLFLPLAYAFSFEASVMSETELSALREALAGRRREGSSR